MRALAVALLSWLLASVALAEPPAEFSRDAGSVVARLTEVSPQVGGASPRVVTVFGDGRVTVVQPAHVRSPDVEHRLTPGQLNALVAQLVALGAADADPAELRARRRGAALARGRLTGVADGDITALELNVRRGGREVRGRFLWEGLRQDARHYPELPELTRLGAAARMLRAYGVGPGARP